MCLVVIAIDAKPRLPVLILGNRDEFYHRETAPADWDVRHPHLLAGTDLRKGGHWLGVTRSGRWAVVTNVRSGGLVISGEKSRGALVRSYLLSDTAPERFLNQLRKTLDGYAPFNLIVGDKNDAWHVYSPDGRITHLAPGIHTLSNADLDTPWPKTMRARSTLSRLLTQMEEPDTETLLELMTDRTEAPDHLLPDTGVGRELERRLSPIFVHLPMYGTRATTLVTLDTTNRVQFVERSWNKTGTEAGTRSFRFAVES